MSDNEEFQSTVIEKLDEIIRRLPKSGSSSSTKTPKKKVEAFKLLTQDLLDSSDPMCAYMQRSEDCEGHCGKPAAFSVIRDHPEPLDSLDDLEEAKNERAELLRKSFLRCNGCKSKAQKMENSRAYKVVKKHLYKQTGEDTAVAADLEAMMGSPVKGKAKKGKAKKGKAKKDDDDDEPSTEEGLDDPEDSNPNLLKSKKWYDKFVKVGKKSMIVRSYIESRKKDVCIGLIDDEPDDDQYEESLRKPSKTFLEKVGLKYVTPVDAAKGTPPKAPKGKSKSDEDSDGSDEEEASAKTKRKTPSKSKGKKKSKSDEDSDGSDDEEETKSKSKSASKSKGKKKPKKEESDDEEEEAKPKSTSKAKGKGKGKGKGKSKKDSDDEDDDEDEGEAEAFRDMADSD
jgi:hypothetical protein